MNKSQIIVHCTDTPHSMKVDVDLIRHWHVKENGWSDIAYAYYIDQSGEVHLGRDLDGDGDVEDEIGAHARGFNRNSIGICLEGRDSFNDVQFDSLRELITDIASRHGIKEKDIVGHCDLDPKKTCPGFNVQQKLKEWKS
ncbi:N-acetylmuramoyl-L-alanine amidase [Aliivibrio salmonicida]|uniref:N-acetylmuramoyl-L-alanine amidase n=1 Tax=Aliivibrio salmonicida TaxID=40269 RepID=UPI003D099146